MSAAALLLLVLLAQAPAPPPAQPPVPGSNIAKAGAQALLREGTALYERGDYAGALEKFRSAYSSYPSPKLLFNIGETNRRLSRPVEALDAFERFLAEAADASAQSRAEAQESVVELKGRLARIAITTSAPGADVAVDGVRVGATPLARPIWVVPGRHQIAVTRGDLLPSLKEVTVKAGDTRSLTLEPHPLDASAPPEAVATTRASSAGSTPITRRWAFWAAVGAVAVLGTVAILASSSSPSRHTDVPDTTLGAQPF